MDGSKQKVKPDHLKRAAYLYIRQSSLYQVFNNQESTRRQYDLRRRAVALGWEQERIVVIDNDLGLSGASSADREGFKYLVGEVGMGKAGIVLGLEVSRLARNSSDWHRLLEICALTDTLILDEDGLYDPSDFNDRLLLGMKGTMSEAELHILRARLRGGIKTKASRGELKLPLPVGLSYDRNDNVILNPDRSVQDAVRLFFKMYRLESSAKAVVDYFAENNLLFPRQINKKPNRGKIIWGPLTHTRALQMLHNPRYAGAFVFGRKKLVKTVDGRSLIKEVPMDKWATVLPDSHPGYISWQEYNDNIKTLRKNYKAGDYDTRTYSPGDGPALLQGIAVCGVCGRKMGLCYHHRQGKVFTTYKCQRAFIEYSDPICQVVPGVNVEKVISDFVVEAVKPAAFEVAFAVQQEVQARQTQADSMRYRKVQRAKYLCDTARERFMEVDPRNRLVADELEADWNEKLRRYNETLEEYERQKQADNIKIDDECRRKIMALVKDFPKIWNDPATSYRQRKHMIRLLIEDVTLTRMGQKIKIQIRLKGGATKTLEADTPPKQCDVKKTKPETIEKIDKLLEDHTDAQVAEILNRNGVKPSMSPQFNTPIVAKLRRTYNLKSYCERLREKGLLTREEIAEKLGVSIAAVSRWAAHGLLKIHRYNSTTGKLYEMPPEGYRPVKQPGVKLTERLKKMKLASYATSEVQNEAQ